MGRIFDLPACMLSPKKNDDLSAGENAFSSAMAVPLPATMYRDCLPSSGWSRKSLFYIFVAGFAVAIDILIPTLTYHVRRI